MTRCFWASVALTVPLLFIELSEVIPGQPIQRAVPTSLQPLIGLMLTTPVVLWAGLPRFVRGWQSIVNGSPNMFSLIGMGVGVFYGYSVFAAIFRGLFSSVIPRR